MIPLTIFRTKTGTFYVHQGELCQGWLGWDEMMALVSVRTMPDGVAQRRDLFGGMRDADHIIDDMARGFGRSINEVR